VAKTIADMAKDNYPVMCDIFGYKTLDKIQKL
jgi:hypothetical protein